MDELDPDFGRFGMDYQSTLRSVLQKNLSGESPCVQISRKSESIFLAKVALTLRTGGSCSPEKPAHFVTDYPTESQKIGAAIRFVAIAI